MTTGPALRLFSNSEFIRYQKNVIKLCNKFNPGELKIDKQVEGLQSILEPMEALFIQKRAHATTQVLLELDARRDRAVVGIRTVAEGYALHFDPALAEAGRTLVKGIDKYGSRISKFNYMAETQALDGLSRDFANDAAMVAVTAKLGLQAWVAELTEANNRFDDNYVDRTADYGDRPTTSLGELRAGVTEKYVALVANVTAHATLNLTEGRYVRLINGLDKLSEQYEKAVSGRITDMDEVDTGSTDIENDPLAAGITQ